jgi:hypothetical protein
MQLTHPEMTHLSDDELAVEGGSPLALILAEAVAECLIGIALKSFGMGFHDGTPMPPAPQPAAPPDA